MALEAPLKSAAGSIISPFSPHTEFSVSSPESPAPYAHFRPMSSASSVESSSLRPSSAARSSSTNNHNYLMSPSDIGPSPVTSVGTEVTEIEDEASDDAQFESAGLSPDTQRQILMLQTNIPDQVRQSQSEEAVSVIHAPESFQSWASSDTTVPVSDAPLDRSSPHTSPKPDSIIVPPPGEQSLKARSPALPTPPPISTDVRPARFSLDSATPRAQNLQDAHSFTSESARLRSSSASSLELIPETREPETDAEGDMEPEADDEEEFVTPNGVEDMEIRSLMTALDECWSFCTTLGKLSNRHRARLWRTSGTPDGHERAWKCCWKLCRQLYEYNRDEAKAGSNVKLNLDLCRDFCQALFDVRHRRDEAADSVLRVSFELNNHLYSAQDSRNLPEPFRERTLDFYITLCHRLMKQHNEVGEETDSLLHACWSLAEMLFSIRQGRRDGRAPDAELLGSAVQACWDLCDLFREGWKQIRPDRSTPRPSQASFFGHQQSSDWEQDGRASRTSNRSSRSKRDSLKGTSQEKPRKPPPVPETPVTEFEDTPISPDSQSPRVPNILVLGTESNRSSNGRWSSSASNLSGYSQSSQRTSSTATTTATAEDANILRVKLLILKAAMNVGYSREEVPPGHNGAVSLQAFVKSLPTGAFGPLPADATLLQHYKNLVLVDSSFRQASSLPARGKRVTAHDIAKSVGWMTHRSGQYGFLRGLFKLVFGFSIDEAECRKNVAISV